MKMSIFDWNQMGELLTHTTQKCHTTQKKEKYLIVKLNL